MRRRLLLSLTALSLMAVQQVMAMPVLKGDIAAYRARELVTGINWNTSLQQALNDGARTGKPVVWMHMLGKIDGAT